MFLFVWIPLVILIPFAVLMTAAWIEVTPLTQASSQVFIYFCVFIVLSHLLWLLLALLRRLLRHFFNFAIEEAGTCVVLLALFFLTA